MKKPLSQRTEEENKILQESSSLVQLFEDRKQKKLLLSERCKEIEETQDVLEWKCKQLSDAIKKAQFIVVYTGAGISTAAQIPDYRGPNGIWTQLNKNGSITKQCDLTLAGSKDCFSTFSYFIVFRTNIYSYGNCRTLQKKHNQTRYFTKL